MKVPDRRSGWFYRHWREIFYRDAECTNRCVGHYVHKFKTVELNSPLYESPKLGTIKSWKRDGRPDFRCSVKLTQPYHSREAVKIFNDDRKSFAIKDAQLMMQFLGVTRPRVREG